MMVSKDFTVDCFFKNWVELVGNTNLSITSNVLGDLQPIWFEAEYEWLLQLN